jgi:hypothetical protein
MNMFKKPQKFKIFCIGCNKTGTTSLETAFKDWGYKLGNQTIAERLVDSYLDRDFEEKLSNTANLQRCFRTRHSVFLIHLFHSNRRFLMQSLFYQFVMMRSSGMIP